MHQIQTPVASPDRGMRPDLTRPHRSRKSLGTCACSAFNCGATFEGFICGGKPSTASAIWSSTARPKQTRSRDFQCSKRRCTRTARYLLRERGGGRKNHHPRGRGGERVQRLV